VALGALAQEQAEAKQEEDAQNGTPKSGRRRKRKSGKKKA
jgi:hypothetical protein